MPSRPTSAATSLSRRRTTWSTRGRAGARRAELRRVIDRGGCHASDPATQWYRRAGMHGRAGRGQGARSAATLIGLSVFGLAAWQACLPARQQAPVTIVYLGSMPAGPAEFDLRQRLLAPFTAKTGIQVKFISGPGSVTERLDLYMRYLESRSATPDVYLLDETFPGVLAEHLLDLEPYLGVEARQHVREAVDHNRVGGRLVGLPLAIDAGLLHYRSDLLRKYGYPRPPETWSELQQMATRIQAGERAAGDRDLWGYVWQGARYEGLTCNGLEWQASSGGGSLIEANGAVAVNNPATVRALTRARGWVGSISPPEVTSYDEDDSEKVWLAGHAAFARRWFVDADRTLRQAEPGVALE